MYDECEIPGLAEPGESQDRRGPPTGLTLAGQPRPPSQTLPPTAGQRAPGERLAAYLRAIDL